MEIKTEANNLSQLFTETALKLSEIILSGEPAKSAPSRIIKCQAVDENSLLYEWLARLIKIADEENLVMQKCEFEAMSYAYLVARVRFNKFNSSHIPTSISQDIHIKKKKKLFLVKVGLDY